MGYDLLARAILADQYYLNGGTQQQAVEVDRGRRRFQEARKLVNQILKLNPENPNHHALLAEVELMDRHPDQALANTDFALDIDPMNRHANLVRLRALALTKRFEEAFELGQWWLAYDPEYADTYWNTVRGATWLFRPFVHWYLTAQKISRISSNWQAAGILTLSALSASAGLVLRDRYGLESAMLPPVVLTALLPVLLSERRCPMAFVDFIMFASSREFRLVANRQRITVEAVITVVVVWLAISVILAGFEIFLPIVILVVLAIFAIPVVTFFYVRSLLGKVGLIINIIGMICLLWFTVKTAHHSQNSSPERLQAFYGGFGFFLLALLGPALFDHSKRAKAQGKGAETNGTADYMVTTDDDSN